MSTEEEIDTSAPVDAGTEDVHRDGKGDDDAADVVGVENDNNNKNNKKNGNKPDRRPARDETPIEDLFDLSKPIPKVERPDKAIHDKVVEELTAAIDTIKEERAAVQLKIDDAMKDPDAKDMLQTARMKFNQLKTEKSVLIDQKKAMRAQLDDMQNQKDKLLKDRKDAKSNIKFTSIKEIEAEIVRLQRKQETTTMSLNEEKKLLKEMDVLQQSKKYVTELQDKDVGLENVNEQRKVITSQISAKDKEIDAISKLLDETKATMDSVNDQEKKKREAIGELFKQRDELKKDMASKIKEKDAVRDEFRKTNNEFYNYQRAVRAQKRMQQEDERRKRDEEKAAYLAKVEAEEAKKIPYEEEQALCDYLADYLERTYLKKEEKKESKKSDVIAVEDDPFAGMKPVVKKDEDEYFGTKKEKKKRVRQAKKQDSVQAPFTLSVDSFEQFGMLNLSPPTSIEQVEASVKELREKKEWYKQQPRGSVPTAAEIRKSREKEAAKMRQSTDNGSAPVRSAKGAFSLSTDDFAPLGEGAVASSSVNSLWGQKPPAPATDADAAVGDEVDAVEESS